MRKIITGFFIVITLVGSLAALAVYTPHQYDVQAGVLGISKVSTAFM